MDGFQELERPTLLVALTNRIDLLDSALLRPGRFEVQVGVDRDVRDGFMGSVESFFQFFDREPRRCCVFGMPNLW